MCAAGVRACVCVCVYFLHCGRAEGPAIERYKNNIVFLFSPWCDLLCLKMHCVSYYPKYEFL